jgi:hypothetical protein
VREQDQSVRRGPLQDHRIGCFRQVDVANQSEFEGCIAAGQAVDDLLVEVLINEELGH